MAMINSSGTSGNEPELMLDINTTPLIDVLLVLLVMLIITIPVQLHAVNIELPIGRQPANPVMPEKIRIDIDTDNGVHWQGVPVTTAQLGINLAEASHQAVQPEIHVRADKHARYAVFVSVMAASRLNGMNRIAVIGSEQFVQ